MLQDRSSQGELTESDPMQVGRVAEGTTNAGVWAVSGFKQCYNCGKKPLCTSVSFTKRAKGKGIFLAKDPRWGKELGKEERWVRKGEEIMKERG